MLRKRVIVAAIVGMVAATLLPSAPATAMSPCQGRSVFGGTGFGQTVYVVGGYTTAGATDVQLTCGVVQNGVTVARYSDKLSGPVAAVAGQANLNDFPFSVCYELFVTYLDRGPTFSDTCP